MAQTTKRGLGRGLESLIPSNFDRSVLVSPEDRIDMIDLAKLEANPFQPRKNFDSEALKELADSIKQYGLIQPIVVTPKGDGLYIIVAGERRWRASKLAGLKNIPAVIRKRKELEQLEVALIENVQRVDLNALEQALSIEKLHQQFNFTYAQIAKRLGKAGATVGNIVRLLNLPDEAKEALASNKITEGHARQILALNNDPENQKFLLESIIKNGWNVRQAERFVVSVKSGVNEGKKAEKSTQTETKETKILAKRLGTDVAVKRMAKGGRLEIRFKDDQDLVRIINSFAP